MDSLKKSQPATLQQGRRWCLIGVRSLGQGHTEAKQPSGTSIELFLLSPAGVEWGGVGVGWGGEASPLEGPRLQTQALLLPDLTSVAKA